jgi:hypothetical protein
MMLERVLVQNLGLRQPSSSNADAAAPSPSADRLGKYSNPKRDDDGGDTPGIDHRICTFFAARAMPVITKVVVEVVR